MAELWTPQELEILRQNYTSTPAKELVKLLPARAKMSIQKKAQQLGLRGYVRSEWSQEDTAWLVTNYVNYTVDQMVVEGLCGGRSKTAIKKKILTLGLEKRTVWSEEENQLLVEKYRDTPVKDLEKEFEGKGYFSIASHARLLGIKKDPSVFRRRYSYNREFFGVPSIENSYFSGFIAADGSVDEGRSTVVLGIHQKDVMILNRLIELINFTGSVEFSIRKTPKGIFKQARLYLSSAQQMVQDLRDNFNITQNKTYTLEPPYKLEGDNALSFIVGLIDGDGSIMVSKPDRYGNQYPIINIGGTQPLLEWVKGIFDFLHLPVGPRIAQVLPVKGANMHSYKVGGLRAYKILKVLEAVKTPTRLERKWSKIKEYENIVGVLNDRLDVGGSPASNR